MIFNGLVGFFINLFLAGQYLADFIGDTGGCFFQFLMILNGLLCFPGQFPLSGKRLISSGCNPLASFLKLLQAFKPLVSPGCCLTGYLAELLLVLQRQVGF